MKPPRPPEARSASRGRWNPAIIGRTIVVSRHREMPSRASGGDSLAEIQPFAGVQYRAADLSRVLAPPYDVIPPATRDELYARDPHNIVRVILNREPGDAGLRRGRGDLPALAGGGRAAGGPDAGRLRARAELRRGRPDPAALRPAGPLPRRGPGAAGHPAPRAHPRGGEGGPLAGAPRHEGQLQPDLPHVPRPGGGVRAARARGDRPTARPRSTPTTAGSATGCGASRSRASSAASRRCSAA